MGLMYGEDGVAVAVGGASDADAAVAVAVAVGGASDVAGVTTGAPVLGVNADPM